MIPDGSPRGAGSPSHAAANAAASTSERFAGLIILITGAHNVTDYAAAHKGRPQSLPAEIIIMIQFVGSIIKVYVPNIQNCCNPCEWKEGRENNLDSTHWPSLCFYLTCMIFGIRF